VKILDEKFTRNKKQYVLQCLVATLLVFAILAILHRIANAAIIAALGASSFVAFAMPRVRVSGARYLIGGYVIGMVVGSLCLGLSLVPWIRQLPIISHHIDVIFGSLAVGLAIFAMAVTNTEPRPRAAWRSGSCSARNSASSR